jgi:hypothetical protein
MATASLTSYIVGGAWVALAYSSDDWRAVVKLVMNLGSIQSDKVLKLLVKNDSAPRR